MGISREGKPLPNRLARSIEISSPHYLVGITRLMARARSHQAEGRVAVASELLHNAEHKLNEYIAVTHGRRYVDET